MAMSGIMQRMTRVSSQPCTKATMRERRKVPTKKNIIPIFSPIPSWSLFRSLDKMADENKHK